MDVKVAFTSTAYGPLWAPAVSSWLRAIGYGARYFTVESIGEIGGAGITDRTYTHDAENALVKEFLANPDLTHLFMTEMDMVLPHDVLPKLMALDKDIASGLYFLRADEEGNRGQPCLYAIPAVSGKETELQTYGLIPVSIFPEETPFEAGCAGLGCILIKRRVLETLKDPWFDLKANGYGSDMYFMKHCRDAGFKLWVEPTVRCDQIDYYVTTFKDYNDKLRAKGAKAYGYIIGSEDPNRVR